uniref:Uncharacterized protein n=1 Tax=Streptomyces rochei TaxID=1928 RepID=Q83WY4_STRRO|nr:hypothetical protein [Streptomyces rochei]BAC76581.1 hypothetical protein [Streptomyces rochei]
MTELPARTAAMDRYHLLLATGVRPMQHGWWGSEAVARDKVRRWIGEYGDMRGARLVLIDEEIGEALAAWPAHG